jgi:hypothetical protein
MSDKALIEENSDPEKQDKFLVGLKGTIEESVVKVNYKLWWDKHLVYILLIALSVSTILGFVLEVRR